MYLECRLNLSIQNDRSPRLSVCLLASMAPSSLSPAKEAMSPGKVRLHSLGVLYAWGSIDVGALDDCLYEPLSYCLSSSATVPEPVLVTAGQLPSYACYSPSRSVTGRMSLVSCHFWAASNL